MGGLGSKKKSVSVAEKKPLAVSQEKRNTCQKLISR
jgi:hypothetical protein